MTTQPTDSEPRTEDVEATLASFLSSRLNTDVPHDQDLFASGLVTSMFAMELVVHIEQTFDVVIVGPDLRLDNFRTIKTMSALVAQLLEDSDED